MQTSGQYVVPELPQYVVGRGPSSHTHMFNISHEVSLSPSPGHAHPHGHSPHPQHHHHNQQQQQQHLHQQQSHLHHSQHPQHHAQSQQPPHNHHQHHHAQSQHSQQQQQQQPQAQPPAPPAQQQQQHQHNQQPQQQQQKIVHQLALLPDSPEDPSPVACRTSPTSNYNKALVAIGDRSLGVAEDDELTEEGEKGTSGNRWPRQETLVLLKIRSDMDATFRDSSLKGPLWEEVSRKLAEMGYHRNAKKCKEKFENVHKYYKRTKDGKTGRQDGKSYRFYSQLEALYGNANRLNNHSNINATNLSSGGGTGATGNGFTSPHGDRTGFLLSRGSTGGKIGSGDGAGVAQRSELDYSSGLNFSSDSSDDDYEDPMESEIPESRKRKRKSERRFMQYLESLMKKVLEKQEQMQQKFLEALERREHDRMIREEAWKRQEMARMTTEHELRAQERALAATRDAALVAFLQKMTGQTLQLPQVAFPGQPSATAPDIHDDHILEKDQFFDPNSKRWPKPEVQALIKLRTGLDTKFHEPGPKGPLWEEISSTMSSLGYNRSAKRCKEKWENINKYFKKAKESDKKRPENSKTCPYFHQLDALYSKGLLGQKQLEHKIEDHSEELLEQPSESIRDEDSGQAQGGDSEILAIMPSGENATAGTSTSDVVCFPSSENGDIGDLVLNKPKLKQNMIDSSSSGNPPATFSQNFDGINIGKALPGNSKSIVPDQDQEKAMQVDHVQLPQRHSLTEDYEKMEMEQDDREQETQHKKQQLIYDGTASSSTLMVLVHKFTSDRPEYCISAPTTAE